MNRKLYVGIMSFFAVVFTISVLFLPFYNPIYFYLQHISLFLFMAMFIYYLLKLGYDRLEKRITKKTALKGYTITLFVVLLFLFSNVQLYAIETYQTSELISCAYYDEHNNAIYYSQVAHSCPNLEISNQTDTELSFVVYETIDGIAERGYMGLDEDTDYRFSAKIRTDINITYDDNGNIVESSNQKSTNILLYYDDEEYKVYNSIYNHIENTVIYDGGVPISFASEQSTGKMLDTFKDFGDIETVEHYLDNQYDFEYVKYTSSKTYADNNDLILENIYSILILDETFDNATFKGEPISSKVLQRLDAICDQTECTIKQKELNLSTDEYALIEDESILDNVTNETILISQDKVSVTYDVYRYTEPVEDTTTIVYSTFKDYGLIFESNTKSYSSLLIPPVERRTFKYRGNDYVEHGDIYSIIYQTDYGYKVMRKNAERDTLTFNHPYPIAYLSSETFEMTALYRINNIYNYGVRATLNPTERDEIFYQKNPLLYSLLEY
ncbi:MAG: hypothetical protein R6U15_04025 [Candidatus Izemoplasmatales bacterium]